MPFAIAISHPIAATVDTIRRLYDFGDDKNLFAAQSNVVTVRLNFEGSTAKEASD